MYYLQDILICLKNFRKVPVTKSTVRVNIQSSITANMTNQKFYSCISSCFNFFKYNQNSFGRVTVKISRYPYMENKQSLSKFISEALWQQTSASLDIQFWQKQAQFGQMTISRQLSITVLLLQIAVDSLQEKPYFVCPLHFP